MNLRPSRKHFHDGFIFYRRSLAACDNTIFTTRACRVRCPPFQVDSGEAVIPFVAIAARSVCRKIAGAPPLRCTSCHPPESFQDVAPSTPLKPSDIALQRQVAVRVCVAVDALSPPQDSLLFPSSNQSISTSSFRNVTSGARLKRDAINRT